MSDRRQMRSTLMCDYLPCKEVEAAGTRSNVGIRGEREKEWKEIDARSRRKVHRYVEDLLLSYDEKGIKIFNKENKDRI